MKQQNLPTTIQPQNHQCWWGQRFLRVVRQEFWLHRQRWHDPRQTSCNCPPTYYELRKISVIRHVLSRQIANRLTLSVYSFHQGLMTAVSCSCRAHLVHQLQNSAVRLALTAKQRDHVPSVTFLQTFELHPNKKPSFSELEPLLFNIRHLPTIESFKYIFSHCLETCWAVLLSVDELSEA